MNGEGWLSKWKNIAKYIGKSTRTAKKYHYKYGMPVHRDPGNVPASLTFELDAWLIEFNRIKKTGTQ